MILKELLGAKFILPGLDDLYSGKTDTLYALLTPFATAVTGYFFVASSSSPSFVQEGIATI
jgi:hypothetical protein